MSIEKARAREAQTGKRVWYPLTQAILGPMVYGNKWRSDLEAAFKKILPGLPKDERTKAENQARKSVIKSYNRRMTRNLSIVNPANGEEWFQILWKLPFEDERFKITIEKLYSISCAACSKDLKLAKLKMLGTDENFRQSYGMPLGDHYYIPWLAKEVWMDQVLEDASRLLEQVLDSTHGASKVVLPKDVHLQLYFGDIVSRYRGVLFYDFQKEMNVASITCGFEKLLKTLGEITEEQRKKMEVELKAFKDKEEQEREALGKNRGRPPSSKGDMPIKDTRNLASPLAHKNVGKGVLLHATLASFNFLKKQGKIKNSKVWNYDYIELGKEFSTRNFKDGFAVMRDFYVGFAVMRDFYVGFGGGPKTRNARPSTWSVDLSVIDLPTGGEVTGFDGIPSWNVLTNDHVKFSLVVASTVVASTVMDDMGWVLVLCPSTSLVRVERMAIISNKTEEEDAKAYGELWPYALKMAKRGKVSRGKLCEAKNCIRETTDPVDLFPVYAYIAKSKANEAWVEETRKRDEETAGTSKRATRSSTKKEEVLKSLPEVNMEDAPKDKKQGATNDTLMLVKYLVITLQQAISNCALQGEFQQQLHTYGVFSTSLEERALEKSLCETSKRGLFMAKEVENS
ncbi:hypothetical protein L7F22_028641 [Adiantum nelumboides]|nr:hypothetical protein [Adiantum nelumboides]